jgi:hypothetical protein
MGKDQTLRLRVAVGRDVPVRRGAAFASGEVLLGGV